MANEKGIKVYLVGEEGWEGWAIRGIFSTRQKAEECKGKILDSGGASWDIKEILLDEIDAI